MRLAVYTDYPYHQVGGRVFAERAFALFLGRLERSFDRLVLIGRLSPEGGRARYAVGEGAELVGLPYYASLARPAEAAPAILRSIGAFWRALDDVDCVWLLGPHPSAILFALIGLLRRRRVVLGVRQDSVEYARSRHPGRRAVHLAAILLDGAFRALGRILPVVAVGPQVAHRYRHSPELLEISVSLVEAADIVDPAAALAARSYEGDLQAISVGRLEAEKNPVLMAEVLESLNERDRGRWRLVVYGEGRLDQALAARAAELGQADRLELRGYVSFGEELMAAYRTSHALLHVSLTEGLPQVLLEAFAAGLPVVASDVGGIRAAVGDAARLVAAEDADEAARSLAAIAADPDLRRRLVAQGHRFVSSRTLDSETDRVARLLRGG